MKETITTIVKEFDEKGNILKETETITEKEYQDYQYTPFSPTTVPITYYPQYHIDSPKIKYELTCDYSVDTDSIIKNIANNMRKEFVKAGVYR